MHISTSSCFGGGTLSFPHDPTACQFCVHTNLFYTIFRPALEKLKKDCSSFEDDYEMCGILTFLEMCFQFGFINTHTKSDIVSNENPPDYTPLLDSIVNAKILRSRPTLSARIRFLVFKHSEKAVKTNKTNESVSKEDFDCCLKHSTSVLTCKDEKTDLDSNEPKRRTSKRHFDDCLKDSTSSLPTKRSRKTLTKSSPKGRRDNNKMPNKPKRKSFASKARQSPSKLRPADGKRKRKSLRLNKVVGKIPTKGTLKRKRWLVKQLETEDNYEDDIFENCQMCWLPKFDEASQSSTDCSNRATPTWEYQCSPRPDSPLPNFEDESILELKMRRKRAEEYQHLRMKRRMGISSIVVPKSLPSEEIKEEDQGANASNSKPSCSYAAIQLPVRYDDDGCDSEEYQDEYFQDSDDENGSNARI